MKIELKNVKYAAFASQETSCFSASVCVDGKRTGTVSNSGFGGANQYYPNELGNFLETYSRNLPDMVCEYGAFPMNADLIIDELLGITLAKKQLLRLMSNRIVFSRDGKIFQTIKLKDSAMMLCDPDLAKKRLRADVILNLIPLDNAVELFRGKK